MAGIGVKLNRIYSKNTIVTNFLGFGYSTVVTIAPMLLVIGAVVLMQLLLGYSQIAYSQRELYSHTVLYIFIFALLTASPFNAVLSRYMSDVIYEERYEDILPCYYIGLIMNMVLSCCLGIVFCVREYFVGKVALSFVFAGYCGYVALVLIFYSMIYLSICKDYQKISLFFLIGMVTTVLLSLFFAYILHMEKTYSMLVSLDIGFLLTGSLEYALTKSYFRRNSGRYRAVLSYFKKHWKLVAANFLYTLGMYIHNFVFWTTDMRIEVANSFVSMTTYDMATCLAMFTNISASVIFISRVEMNFHEKYKRYSEAVIGGTGLDIENAKDRMFAQLSEELMNLVRIQFIVSVVIYFLMIIILPQIGYGGILLQIYPCLAAGYFILFVMYSEIIFLYYYNDLNGAVETTLLFCLCTMAGAVLGTHLTTIWYGIGPVIGAAVGWSVAYHRLRYIEKNLDIHIFCAGSILKKGHGRKPSNKVYKRR